MSTKFTSKRMFVCVCVGRGYAAPPVVLSHPGIPDHRALADHVGVNEFKGVEINQRPWESPQG